MTTKLYSDNSIVVGIYVHVYGARGSYLHPATVAVIRPRAPGAEVNVDVRVPRAQGRPQLALRPAGGL